MMKNTFFSAFAFASLLTLAACGGDVEEAEVVEEPVIEEQAPMMEPAPAPMVTDTAAMPMTDTTGMPVTDTAGM